VKENIDAALEKAKKALESQEVESLRSAIEELNRSSHKLAEAMYAKASSQQQGSAHQGGDKQGQTADGGGKKKEDVVDADFEEVKD
jgi:molecular chaperone DnaK